ncbi:Uncharacterized protein DAT39_020974, partial [Clarias magur]
MRRAFNLSHSSRELVRQLLQLSQGPRSAYDYVIEFQTLVDTTQPTSVSATSERPQQPQRISLWVDSCHNPGQPQ